MKLMFKEIFVYGNNYIDWLNQLDGSFDDTSTQNLVMNVAL